MEIREIKFGFKIGLALGSVILGSLLLFTSVVLVQAGPRSQTVAEGRTLFEEKCQSCHTVGGGDAAGPDLMDVTGRREREWLISFIMSPEEMIQEGDPIATELYREYNELTMPDVGLSQDEAKAVLSYIESRSGGEGGEGQESSSELPQGSVERGRALFNGRIAFDKGGTPCVGCHSMGDFGALGGGNFGPDLTHVYSRYGEEGLISALENVPFPTMKPIFANNELTAQEQADLAAYFQWADTNTRPTEGGRVSSWMWVGGGIGVGILFGIMFMFWPRQRSSLSERLRRNQ